MTAILRHEQLSGLLTSRLASRPPVDDVADIVLGPRIHGICTALGVPARDWLLFSQWADRPGDPRAVAALGSYIDVMVADRCGRLADDLISDLIAVEIDGQELTADELREIVVELVMF